jgi:hypothetical protein
VDRNRQIAIEMDKINKEYREHNMIRDFELTSWAHTNELFPWTDILTKKVGNLHIIDWAKCGNPNLVFFRSIPQTSTKTGSLKLGK